MPEPRQEGGHDERFPLAPRALATFGPERQLKALGEENAEAAAAILRYLNGKGDLAEVREELTDVESVLASLRDHLGTPEEWEATREQKRAKLWAKLEAGDPRTRPVAEAPLAPGGAPARDFGPDGFHVLGDCRCGGAVYEDAEGTWCSNQCENGPHLVWRIP